MSRFLHLLRHAVHGHGLMPALSRAVLVIIGLTSTGGGDFPIFWR